MEAEIASKCKSVVIIGSLRPGWPGPGPGSALRWCDRHGKLRENSRRAQSDSHSSPFVRNVTKQREERRGGPTTNIEKFYLTDFIWEIYDKHSNWFTDRKKCASYISVRLRLTRQHWIMQRRGHSVAPHKYLHFLYWTLKISPTSVRGPGQPPHCNEFKVKQYQTNFVGSQLLQVLSVCPP